MEIKQKLRVIEGKKEGWVLIKQSFPWEVGVEYEYEVPIENLDATIKELDRLFKQMVSDALRMEGNINEEDNG